MAIEFDNTDNTTAQSIDMTGLDSLTTGGALRIQSNSADTSTRNLVDIVNDSVAATGAVCLNIKQDANQQAMAIVNPGTTTQNVIGVVASVLTTGRMLDLFSDSSSASTRSLARIINNNVVATGTTVLEIIQAASQRALFINQTANGTGIDIDTAATTANALEVNGDSLTGGGLAIFNSNSVDTSTRFLLQVANQNELATGTTVLNLKQDSTGRALFVSGPVTTAVNVIDVSGANSLTTGGILLLQSNSANVGLRSLLQVVNDNPGSTGTTVLAITQNAAQRAVFIDHTANGTGIDINTAATTANALEVNGDFLTTGGLAIFNSNSADTGARNIVRIVQDNTAATGAIALNVQQDADNVSIDLLGTGGGSIQMLEIAAVPGGAPIAGRGKDWIRDDAPNIRMWTDDAGTDFVLNKAPKITTFTTPQNSNTSTNSNFTPDPDAIRTVVEMCGGGGGGGSATCTGGFISISTAAGGGGYLKAETTTKLTGTIAVTVGHGSVRVTSKPLSGQTGIFGGNTTFGTSLTAFGGGGARLASTTSSILIFATAGGGANTVGGTFTALLQINGGNGKGGYAGQAAANADFLDGGDGGDSFWGTSAKTEPAINGSGGQLSLFISGQGHGQGACGLATNKCTTAQEVRGGAGRAGLMIITEYFS